MKFKITFEDNFRRAIINGQRTTRDHSSQGRSVYIGENFVLKVDDRGYQHDDMAVWESIRPEHREYFVPTLAQGRTHNGCTWSLQPFVELDWLDIDDDHRELVEWLVNEYELDDIDDEDIFDYPRNWGMHDGKPIIFDYGF